MRQIATRLFLFFALVLLVGCASTAPREPVSQAVTSTPLTESAELFVFNISGWTLFPHNQNVTDNGSRIASLPRGTYEKVRIAPGRHKFQLEGIPEGLSGPRVATLNAEKDRTYYLVVGYLPSVSWAFPFAGDPIVIKLVPEEEASKLMKEMHSK